MDFLFLAAILLWLNLPLANTGILDIRFSDYFNGYNEESDSVVLSEYLHSDYQGVYQPLRDYQPESSAKKRETVHGSPAEWSEWGDASAIHSAVRQTSTNLLNLYQSWKNIFLLEPPLDDKAATKTQIFGHMPPSYLPEGEVWLSRFWRKLMSNTIPFKEAKRLINSAQNNRNPDHNRVGASVMTDPEHSILLAPLPEELNFRILDPEHSSCDICFEQYTPPTIDNNNRPKIELVSYNKRCSHHFHPRCIDEWIKTFNNWESSTCPTCRVQL
ncbi:hypothetical protein PTTG_28514 [Puccinia triticina 1-1 BBBD Race 1]|uniref:RING-type domain-containing protein n=2 Tax=Puccinia triticina TaxID=208348 RepID=A0A180GAU4_PUCT1|nr:uncharacterized protein PtA15_2A709 [Puccinia triticina]OAV89856.1 hypothetical protein PTTG_28514 [Puccinia triticina 1-1 BBBD Race 1]WAQ82392.1 hypothetical protein PtA15_2A709 [Puccinia triticina]WAR53246.1 hypothetical protein PtB15_2B677 [Puccinia triticina]